MGIQAHINMPSIHNDHFIQDMPVEIVLIFHTVGNLLNCTCDFLKSCRVHSLLILTEDRMNYRKKLRGNTLSVKLQAPCYQIHYVDGIFIVDTGSRTANRITGRIDMARAVFCCLIASPVPVAASVPAGLVSGNITAAAAAAFDFAGKQIAVGVFCFPGLRCCAFVQNPIGFIEQFSGDNRFMMVFQDNKRFLPIVVFFLVGQIIRCVGFLLNQIAAVFLIP